MYNKVLSVLPQCSTLSYDLVASYAAAQLMLYFTYSTHSNILTNTCIIPKEINRINDLFHAVYRYVML